MKLSAPIFRLKRQAKLLSREQGISLHVALDRVASNEGFQRWSQLAAVYDRKKTAKKLLNKLDYGDLILLCAQRDHGKTTLAFELMAETVKEGRRSAYFSLSDYKSDIPKRFAAVGIFLDKPSRSLTYDTSEDICATYIINKMSNAQAGTLIVIDYLQILDQQRQKPSLSKQVSQLKKFALSTESIIVFISQIDRAFDPDSKIIPNITDVHLPNPVDFSLFTQTCFLNNGEIYLDKVA